MGGAVGFFDRWNNHLFKAIHFFSGLFFLSIADHLCMDRAMGTFGDSSNFPVGQFRINERPDQNRVSHFDSTDPFPFGLRICHSGTNSLV